MKTWLKGGLIGGGIGLILMLIPTMWTGIRENWRCQFMDSNFSNCFIPFALVSVPELFLVRFFYQDFFLKSGFSLILIIFFSLVNFFIIGAIVGLIVGKIKSKRKKR